MNLVEELTELRAYRDELVRQARALVAASGQKPTATTFADMYAEMAQSARQSNARQADLSFLAFELVFVERQIIAILGNAALQR